MPRDPADVGSAPVHVGVLHIENELVRRRDAGEISGRRVHDALRLRRRPGRVEQVEHVLALERFGRALGLLAIDDVVPPDVASFGPGHVLLGAADDKDRLDALRLGNRVVSVLLEGDGAALAVAAVGRDQDLRFGIIDATRERFGGEATEDDRERRSDARAREHRRGKLGDHRHVDRDPVALAHTELFQGVRGAGCHTEKVLVADRSAVARLPLPVVGDLGALARLYVAVEAVLGDVELAT